MKYYFNLACRDVFRLWSATQLQIIIIAGICLPILMLMGLKNGHVAELRQDLETSPTGRRIKFAVANRRSEFITDSVIHRLKSEIPNVELILPGISENVLIGAKTKNKDQVAKGNALITLTATLPGDPILDRFGGGVELANREEDEIILSSKAANTLNVGEGSKISIEVLRQLNGANEPERHLLDCTVKRIIPDSNQNAGNAGYAPLSLIQKMELYLRGRAVPDWNVAVSPELRASPEFHSYWLFCPAEEDLTEKDLANLKKQNLVAKEISDSEKLSLYGLLQPSARQEIKIYEIVTLDDNLSDESARMPVMDDPQTLARYTSPLNDFIVFGALSRQCQINELYGRVIGINLPSGNQRGSWIQDYLRPGVSCFSFQEAFDNQMSAKMSTDLAERIGSQITLRSPAIPNQKIKLDNLTHVPDQNKKSDGQADEPLDKTVNSESSATGESQPTAKNTTIDNQTAETDIVPTIYCPVGLVACIDQLKNQKIAFDDIGNRFVSIPLPLDYEKAFMFTKGVDDVPLAANMLEKLNYHPDAKHFEILEIQEQSQSLEILVLVVAIGVFIFGVITVFSVLVDSTDRKKGTIGIFRVMGMTGFGVFLILIARAMIIGLLAAILCSCIGIFLSYFLATTHVGSVYTDWIPQIDIILTTSDYITIAFGALLCAVLGVLVPAIKASRLDPFEAIMQGQFN